MATPGQPPRSPALSHPIPPGVPAVGRVLRQRRATSRRGAALLGLALGMLQGLGLGPGPGPATAGPLPPLSEPQQRIIESPGDEKPYNVRLHFLKSNERRHDLFFSSLRGLGGGYLGVGADQNYTLAAIARAELVWLVDIDGDVVQWHKIYAALIPLAASPAELLTLLGGRRDGEVKAALVARWGEEGAKLFPTFLRYRGYLLAHLGGERTVMQRGKPVTWVSDPALYQHVRSLMIARRVVPRVGDLHGEATMLGIAQAAKQAGVTLRTVYLSNAEQWFRYSPQFQRNMLALPHEPRTLVLRTLARGELPTPDGDRWHFSVQTLDAFLSRMAEEQHPARKVGDLVPDMLAGRRLGSPGLSWLGPVQPPPRTLYLAELPAVRPADPAPPVQPAVAIGTPPAALPAGPKSAALGAPPANLIPVSKSGAIGAPPAAPAPVPKAVAFVAWNRLPPLRYADAVVTKIAPVGAVSQAAGPRPLRPWSRLPPLRTADAVLTAPRPRIVPDWSRLPLRLADPLPAITAPVSALLDWHKLRPRDPAPKPPPLRP